MFSSSRFTNIVVKWPGSTHYSFILNNSGKPDVMTGINGWLLGDSEYPLKKMVNDTIDKLSQLTRATE